jgi:hypothetical protein
MQRETDIFVRRSTSEIDTIVFRIPNKFLIANLPDKTEIRSKFGYYSSEIIIDKNNLLYIRNFDLRKGLFQKEEYSEFRGFFDKISKADQKMIALKKNS